MLNTPNPRVCSGWSAYFCTAAATAEIYTLSLHDALPILQRDAPPRGRRARRASCTRHHDRAGWNLERPVPGAAVRSEEHTSELQSRRDLVCRLLLEKKKKKAING